MCLNLKHIKKKVVDKSTKYIVYLYNYYIIFILYIQYILLLLYIINIIYIYIEEEFFLQNLLSVK